MMCTRKRAGEPGGRGAGLLRGACIALCLLGAPAVAEEVPAASLADMLRQGENGLALRYRLEFVDIDGNSEEARASTLRLRLNRRTARWRNWQAFAELDYVTAVLLDDFNSGGGTSPARSQYPVVADPGGADLNQLYLDYQLPGAVELRLGRQRILLNNQRHLGGVGWRQNEQTFDSASFRYNGIERLGLRYAYLARVKRIFGDDSPAGSHDLRGHLLDLRLVLPRKWTLTPYLLYVDNRDAAAASTLTIGGRLSGRVAAGERALSVSLDVANQTEAADAPVDYRAGYLRLDASLPLTEQLTAGLGYEVLGGDSTASGAAFRTPLATLHAFQGWADQLLATPDQGVEDLFVTASLKLDRWQARLAWHRFSAEEGSADWGSELDASFARPIGDGQRITLKLARFNADDAAFRDATKVWLMWAASF